MALWWWLSRVLLCLIGNALRLTAARGINTTAEAEGTGTEDAVLCPSFETPTSGGPLWHPVKENYTVGETVTFSCDTGWHLQGVATMICQDDTRWSGSLPTCYEKKCLMPSSSTELGMLPLKEQYHYNESIVFTCNRNWRLEGSSTTRCKEDGTWTVPAPECLQPWCAAPPMIANATYSTDTEPNGASYSGDTIATYSCITGFTLVGRAELTCLPNGTWTLHDMTCQSIPTTTTTSHPPHASDTHNNTTSTVSRHCGNPPNFSPSPNLITHRIGNVLHYSCDDGYVLFGVNTSHCLSNGSWFGALPRCVAPATAVPVEASPATTFRWEQVFIAYADWSGQYKFHGEKIDFHFEVNSVQLDAVEAVQGLFSEEHAHFTVKGFQDSTGGIILEIVRIIHSGPGSARYNPMDWRVQGHLVENECTWSYVGQIHSKTSGFGTLSMYTSRNDVTNDVHCAQVQNMTLIIVSITLACILVVVLGIIAIICVRRTGGIRSSGHRTLTSFENPVYEYENSLNSLK